MTILKSHSTYSPTGEKVTTSNHYSLTGNLFEKHNWESNVGPLAYHDNGLPELSNLTAEWTCNSHKLPMVQPVPALTRNRRGTV